MRSLSRVARNWEYFAAAFCLLGFLWLGLALPKEPCYPIDLTLTQRLQEVSVTGFHTLMVWVSVPADGWNPWFLTGIVGTILLVRRRTPEGKVCLFGIGFGAILIRATKILVARPRPSPVLVGVWSDIQSGSYPSGHVMYYVEFFGFLIFLIASGAVLRRHKWLALSCLGGLVVLVGPSRVYLGAHWASDVLGALLGGTGWLILMIATYRKLTAKG
jgi:undecaprenyl-diphosphatase